MNQHEAPVGTIARLGHPDNDARIVKTGVGWIFLATAEPVDPEAFRAGWDVITPNQAEAPTEAAVAGHDAPARP
jgi:hypothetical protein